MLYLLVCLNSTKHGTGWLKEVSWIGLYIPTLHVYLQTDADLVQSPTCLVCLCQKKLPLLLRGLITKVHEIHLHCLPKHSNILKLWRTEGLLGSARG